ncbi:MAG: amidohydrolase family protein [Armatimonadota bacterium]|nr:amidohydrolase family protein [Armatimonadota bacterium]
MIIDCNANLGSWPFRRTSYNTPQELIERLGRVEIDRAWVTSLDAVMLKNVHAANAPLAEAVADFEQLTPVGSVNPDWPAWERDIAECAEQLGFPGVRVNPNYHGWTLEEPIFGELLAAADDLGLFVEVTVRMTDERHHHPRVMVPPVALTGLLPAAADHPNVPIVVANAKNAEANGLARDAGAELPANLYFEISHFESVGGVQDLAESLGIDHLLFGTHAPYYYPESSHMKVFEECAFSDADLAKLTHGNAKQVLGE